MKESKINPIPDSVKAAVKRTEAEILAFLDVGGNCTKRAKERARTHSGAKRKP